MSPAEQHGERGTGGRVLLALAGLAAIALLALLRDHWPARLLELALLLALPGVLLLRALRVPGAAIAGFPLYIPCASIVVIVLCGLAVDLAGPPLGIDQPLRTGPVLAALELGCGGLLLASIRAPAAAGIPWERLVPRLRELWPLLLPAVAAAGALRFAHGHGPVLSVLALIAALIALVACALLAPRLGRRQLAIALFAIGLAAMWSFSLRTPFVYGYDIATELHIAQDTIATGVWHASHHGDPYGAMLSLTVLPATLHELAGVRALGALQALYPMLIALFPVGLFALAGRMLERRWAFVAAAFVVAQSYFFQELPTIARQEIALLLFVALVAAMLDARLPRRAAWPLLALLGVAVTVSHYSTAYLTIGVLAGALVIQALVSLRRPLPHLSGAMAVALAATAIGAGVWYGPVTHSAANLSQFTDDLRAHGLDLLPNASAGQSLIESYLKGNSPRRLSVARYQADAVRQYRAQRSRYVHPLKAAADPRFAMRDARGVSPPEPALDTALSGVQLIVSQLANVLAALGVLALALRRGVHPIARQLGILGVATLFILAFVRLSGTAADAYNQERAFVQTMVPLAIGMAWLLQAAARRWRPRAGLLGLAAAAGLLVLFLGNSGLRRELTGGTPPLNLASSGEDYDRYYVTPGELAASLWFDLAPRPGLLYADRYARLRVLARTGDRPGLLTDVLPATLDEHAWVFASQANVRGVGRAPADSIAFAIYDWPQSFLNRYWARVYTNGQAEVYHR